MLDDADRHPAAQRIHEPEPARARQLLPPNDALANPSRLQKLGAEGARQQSTVEWRRVARAAELHHEVAARQLGELTLPIPEENVEDFWRATRGVVVRAAEGGLVMKPDLAAINWCR